MPRIQDQALCLRSRDWSETSQLVVLFTRGHGKLRGLAKGSKRLSPGSVARFSGGIELLQRGTVVAITRSTAELANLTEWDLLDDHAHLRVDLASLQRACYAAEVADLLIADEQPHPAVFAGLSAMLAHSGEADLLRFQWLLLGEAGFRPQLWLDVHDQGDLHPSEAAERDVLWFDPAGGGLTRHGGVSDWRVQPRTVAALRALNEAGEFEDDELDAVTRANRLLCAYIRHLLERETATMAAIMRR